ncbi:MAG: hypothetical protein N4J56_007029 [Chroococcidiopsis sp. SAG 2025]|nr:hypothetical protein [Chroococcidiopsis sp. SAG 2025]
MKLFSRTIALTIMFNTILANAPIQPVGAADSHKQSDNYPRNATVDGQHHLDEQLLLLSQNQKSKTTLRNLNKSGDRAFIPSIECHSNRSKCSKDDFKPPTLLSRLSPDRVIQKTVCELPILLKKAGLTLLMMPEGVGPLLLASATIYVFWRALSSSSGRK